MKKRVLKLQTPKTKNNEVVTFRQLIAPVVSTSLASLVAASHSVKVSYEIMKVNDAVRKLHEQYENLRTGLIDKYGKKGADGKLEIKEDRYVIEKIEEFNKEYEELINIEVNVPRIPLSYLSNNPEVKVSPAQLKFLMGIIVDPAL